MDAHAFVEALSRLDQPAEQERLIRSQALALDAPAQDELAQALKDRADRLMHTNIQGCLQTAGWIETLASLTGNPTQRALWLLALANANSVVLGDFRKAVECYAEATAIYREQGDLEKQAQTQIGYVWALASLGKYDDAFQAGEWAEDVLREQQEWFHLARLQSNLAAIRGRLSQFSEALVLFDKARQAYQQLGIEGQPHWLRVEVNRANVLRYLGRFAESIQASQAAIDSYSQMNQPVAMARAQQSLANTYYILGRYNEALALLDGVREVLRQDGRLRQSVLVELFISDCLLQLRRFSDVIEKCGQVRQLFGDLGTRFEVGQAILNEGRAYAGLGREPEAINSLAEARQIFQDEGNQAAMAESDLETARVYLGQGQPEKCLELALACAEVFHAQDLPVWGAQSLLLAGRACLAAEQYQQASACIQRALAIAQQAETDFAALPAITYPCHHLLGQIAVRQQAPEAGLREFEQAIQDLERLCGRLMVEFRAAFVEDKGRVYEDAVALCLDLERPLKGLEYAERAKSRALLDLLSQRVDLNITPRSPADLPLVEELIRLRQARDGLYRHMLGESLNQPASPGQRGETASLVEQGLTGEQQVLELEKRITELWHKLLVRNADYAGEAAMWQVRAEPIQEIQQTLDPDVLLLVFFEVAGKPVVFRVTRSTVDAVRLEVEMAQIQRLLQYLWLNLGSVPRADPQRLANLELNAKGILKRLYQGLFAPLGGLGAYRRVIIVPHGILHYLPFHALYDGKAYLLEKHDLSYLPGASFLRYARASRPPPEAGGTLFPVLDLLALGHSYLGKLPYTVEEARAIAGLWSESSAAVVGEQATLELLRRLAPQARVLHLATHGDFRPDNPLFSGLALQDGWLTTLDIFNLRLQASLVTLSACQTGRSVVGGGDELLGLMRAFLAAGARSLVATLWAVEDRSTARLMLAFYQGMAAGETKAGALRLAQLALMGRDAPEEAGQYRHPYFWAPFYLVGEAGEL